MGVPVPDRDLAIGEGEVRGELREQDALAGEQPSDAGERRYRQQPCEKWRIDDAEIAAIHLAGEDAPSTVVLGMPGDLDLTAGHMVGQAEDAQQAAEIAARQAELAGAACFFAEAQARLAPADQRRVQRGGLPMDTVAIDVPFDRARFPLRPEDQAVDRGIDDERRSRLLAGGPAEIGHEASRVEAHAAQIHLPTALLALSDSAAGIGLAEDEPRRIDTLDDAAVSEGERHLCIRTRALEGRDADGLHAVVGQLDAERGGRGLARRLSPVEPRRVECRVLEVDRHVGAGALRPHERIGEVDADRPLHHIRQEIHAKPAARFIVETRLDRIAGLYRIAAMQALDPAQGRRRVGETRRPLDPQGGAIELQLEIAIRQVATGQHMRDADAAQRAARAVADFGDCEIVLERKVEEDTPVDLAGQFRRVNLERTGVVQRLGV